MKKMTRKDQDEFSAGTISLLPLLVVFATIYASVKVYNLYSNLAAIIIFLVGIVLSITIYKLENNKNN